MITRILQTNPALFIGLSTAVVDLLVGWGLLSIANGDAIKQGAAVVIPFLLTFLASFLIKSRVYSPATVARLTNDPSKLKP